MMIIYCIKIFISGKYIYKNKVMQENNEISNCTLLHNHIPV